MTVGSPNCITYNSEAAWQNIEMACHSYSWNIRSEVTFSKDKGLSARMQHMHWIRDSTVSPVGRMHKYKTKEWKQSNPTYHPSQWPPWENLYLSVLFWAEESWKPWSSKGAHPAKDTASVPLNYNLWCHLDFLHPETSRQEKESSW